MLLKEHLDQAEELFKIMRKNNNKKVKNHQNHVFQAAFGVMKNKDVLLLEMIKLK